MRSEGPLERIGIALDRLRYRMAVEPRRVLPGDRLYVGLRDAREPFREHRLGIGPGRITVRVVLLHEDVIRADPVAQGERRWVLDRAVVEVPPQNFRRCELDVDPRSVHLV